MMKIAAIGSVQQLAELQQVIAPAHTITQFDSSTFYHDNFDSFDIIIDLGFDDRPDSIRHYAAYTGKTLLLSAVKVQLQLLMPPAFRNTVIGINAIPTFLGRPFLEASSPFGPMPHDLICTLGWQGVNEVADRVGMVSPRIVFMIINEAYFTLQEGTAGKEDIDKGMKLGTAYPYGPFDWCNKIGPRSVYDVLSAVAADTMDERYKICNLLKTEALRQV